MPARSGAQYLAGLRDGRSVWYAGEPVSDVTSHAAFVAGAQTVSRLYELQQEADQCKRLTYVSPQSGEPVGRSFYMPQSVDDLVRRREMLDIWAKTSCGMLGQSPDYMNIGVMALASARDVFARIDARFGVHIQRYYEMCREQDLCLAHVPILSAGPAMTDSQLMLGVVSSQADGLTVSGACWPVSLAPLADEIVVGGGMPLRSGQGQHAVCFALPVATEGLTIVCRETYGRTGSSFDHPLSTRFETMDCMLLFEEVWVPWERVFLSANIELHNRLLEATGFNAQVGHQVLVRQVAKTTVLLGIAQLLSTTIGIGEFLHVQAKIGEIITTLEALRSCLRRAEVDAVVGPGGVIVPQRDAIQAGQRLFAALHPRLIEILQLLGAGGYMMTPSEADLQGPMAEVIDRYYQGASVSATDRIQLFRLAWDVVGDQFGSRQQLHEREFAGDPVYQMASQYREYDTGFAVEQVKALLELSRGH